MAARATIASFFGTALHGVIDARAESGSTNWKAESWTEESVGFGRWLPDVQLEDYECRGRAEVGSVVDWNGLRKGIQTLVDNTLDEFSLKPISGDGQNAALRRALQMELIGPSAVVMLRFQASLDECPIGTVVASLFLSCLAHLPLEDVFDKELPIPYAAVLDDLRKRPFHGLLEKDLRLLFAIASVHIVAATEWNVFGLLTVYIDRVVPLTRPPTASTAEDPCVGTAILGHSSEKLRTLLLKHVPYASGKDIQGLKFLKGLDSTVMSVMKDPSEFVIKYIHECPAGAAAFASTAVMLALMTNPSIVEPFARIESHILQVHLDAVVAGASQWGIFHAFAKQGTFATRSFDLVWSMHELLPVPADPMEFDSIRTNPLQRQARLVTAAETHPHEGTRRLSGFLVSLEEARKDDERPEQIVYLTSVGGQPFSSHIAGFVRRSVFVGLPALIIVCMDRDAYASCEAAVEGVRAVCCVPSFEGTIVLVKHAFIPMLLSAGVDTVWIDFDTFIVKDPTPALIKTRDDSESILLATRPRVRFGTFLFENSSDMCFISKVCDKRQQWSFSVDDKSGLQEPNDLGAEILVTEHWDARCLNNGLFYVRATHRPLVFFALFLAQLFSNPYIDNQNLLDAYLVHSSFDSAAPEARPLLRYATLNIERHFACAEGYMGDPKDVVTFHFWSSDFRTREATEEDDETESESGGIADSRDIDGVPSRIKLRNGVERVPKPIATKAELFQLFFGGNVEEVTDGLAVPVAAATFFRRVRAPSPKWRGLCSTTGVGVEELVDERLLQGNESLVDWDSASAIPGGSLDAPSSSTPVDTTHQSATALAPGTSDAAISQGSPAIKDSIIGPSCAGIQQGVWVRALQRVADLEDANALMPSQAAQLKARLRRLDARSCLTVLAWDIHVSRERLALEVKALLADYSANAE
eukprot:TRINITY_DN49664_c0_g1_i1.p1 TRINITY_DN49664_c0_g1~~TRINITY_DN49664_c0_g1_i1.p1  ORF type:complete len:926 (+),score=113.39 TRINITY_DN49664_c0_g1_i1:26-2803(+)